MFRLRTLNLFNSFLYDKLHNIKDSFLVCYLLILWRRPSLSDPLASGWRVKRLWRAWPPSGGNRSAPSRRIILNAIEGGEIVEEVVPAGKVVAAAEVIAEPGTCVVRRGRPPIFSIGFAVAAGIATVIISVIIIIELISNRLGDSG